MAQRTGRRVSSDAPHLPAHGKKIKDMNGMQPGMPQDMSPGAGDPSDYSAGHDKGSGGSAPKGSHKGPSSK